MLSEAIEIMGWTLLHFVWQGFAAAVLLAALLLMLRRATAHARYLAACGVFGLMAFAPLITSCWLTVQTQDLSTEISADLRRVGRVIETHQNLPTDVVGLDDSTHPTDEPTDVDRATPVILADPPQRASVGSRTPAASATVIAAGPSWLERIRQLAERHLGVIVGAWLFGVAILSLRLLAGWLSVQRLRRRFHQPAHETWQALLRRLAERLRVTRPVQLVESALVEVPTVIGWLKPVILLPASAMTGLTTEQLEALLAHELAHVRRHDYLINLLQTVVETLLFYHPAVWWVSHRIRVEREHCCDDLAVQVCGDGLTYAKALVALEELRAPKLGLAMSARGGSLLTRVARLLGQAEQQRRPTGWIAGLLSLVLLTMAGALGAGLLAPPDKPTEGLPNVEVGVPQSEISNLKSQIPNFKQETRAEREDEQRKLPPPKGEFYDAARPRTDGVKPSRGSGTVSGAISGKKKEPDRKMLGQFVGRVRLKTEKPFPDLEKVEVPAGKVLDESLVFSKDGGLANVFVYLRKPTFAIEPPTEAELAKPFVLIVDSGKFWPHAAFVRTGRPVVLENGAAETMNIHTHPIRNNPVNVSVPAQGRIKAPAFDRSENLPLQVKNDVKPWMLAHLLTLDHPFAAITDDDGCFAIKGLPPGEHEFRVWHERVGWLEKSLVITVKPGEDARSELEYAPDRLKLTEAELLAWGKRLIDAKWIPRLRVPRPAAPKKEDEGKADLPEAPDTKESPQKQPKVETEAEQAWRAIIRQQAENDVTVRFAKKSAEVAKAEWEKLLAANRSVPGAISESEVRRVKAKYEIALLQIEHAEAERAAARSQLEDKSLEEPSPKTVELRQRAAKTAAEIAKANAEIVKAAIERAVAFLKTQQQESGTWQGTPADGVTALCAASLLQAGAKSDDPTIQKALTHLRKVEPTLSYTVALQTMVFCMALPKEDAERIRRNVTWLEQAQATEGPNRGAWSYAAKNAKFGDGSCSRFAMLGLHAAKRAGFEVKAETWRNASDYYLSSQKAGSHVWGYTPEAGPTPTMTLAAMAGLAILNQHLPQDEQSQRRTEAIDRAVPYVESNAGILWNAGHGFYSLHGLERAAHLNRWTKLGKHELSKLLDEKLTGLQRPDGSWAYVGGGFAGFGGVGEQTKEQKEAAAAAAKLARQSNDLIATSFALLALTGQPEPKLVARRFRIEPRDADKPIQIQTYLMNDSVPPRQRTEISGGVRIEAIESDGSKWRIEADRAVIESIARANHGFEINGDSSDLTRVVCIGSVKLEAGSGEKMTRMTGENLELDLRANGGWLNQRPEWLDAIEP